MFSDCIYFFEGLLEDYVHFPYPFAKQFLKEEGIDSISCFRNCHPDGSPKIWGCLVSKSEAYKADQIIRQYEKTELITGIKKNRDTILVGKIKQVRNYMNQLSVQFCPKNTNNLLTLNVYGTQNVDSFLELVNSYVKTQTEWKVEIEFKTNNGGVDYRVLNKIEVTEIFKHRKV